MPPSRQYDGLFVNENTLNNAAQRFDITCAGAGTAKPASLSWTTVQGKMLRRVKLLEIAADRASEPPANIAQSKRIGA